MGRVLSEHRAPVSSLDFTNDGELLLSAGEDERICVYSCQSGTLNRVVQCPQHGVSIARFTHDPLTVLCASRRTAGRPATASFAPAADEHALRYHSLHDNTYLRFFRGHTADVHGLELSPKEDCFASIAADNTLRTWDLRSPNCSGMMQFDSAGYQSSLSYDPEGLVLAVAACGSMVKLFDVRYYSKGPFVTWTPVGNQPKNFSCISFSRDGKMMLLGTGQGIIYNLDAFTGALLQQYTGHANTRGIMLEACFSADGLQVLCGSEDGTVWRWRTNDGQPVSAPLTGHLGPVTAMRCNPTRQLIASACSHVCLWLPVRRSG